jgi:predicted MFS family arabinose efflux permease
MKHKLSRIKLEVLKLRDFRVTLLTRLFVMTAWIAQDVIIGWQVYSLTHDTFMLGLTGLVEAVPALISALFAGHIVDISRPYRVLLGCIAVLAVNAIILMLVGGEYVAAPGGILPWLFGGIFISGLARAFTMPASFALLPQIVPRVHMPSASALLTTGFQGATVIAPAIAGVVYGGYGARIAWLLPVFFILLALLLQIVGISATPCQWRSAQKREPAGKSIRAGWRFIFTHKILLAVMALDMFAVLFGGAVAMLPAVADQMLHVGSEGLGALRAAPALGAIVTALVLAVLPFKTIRASWLLWVIVGFGGCMIGFGLSQSFALSMGLLALSGAFDSVSMVIRSTLMQWLTPDDMRGRVSSVNSMFIISSNEIGSFESGTAAKLLGLVPSIVFGGVGTLVVVAITALLSPTMRKLVVQADEKS